MWHLKCETQGHKTEDMGMAFETPALAYEAVERFSDRAQEYEEEGFIDLDLAYDSTPDSPNGWLTWLKKHGWPVGCVPVLIHDDGRMMADRNGKGFVDEDLLTHTYRVFPIKEAIKLALHRWYHEA